MASANRFARNFFFARAAIVSVGKNIQIFRDNNGQKQRLYPPVPKRRQFPTFSLGLEFSNEAEKEKNNGIGAITIRFTGRGWNVILTERHSGKTKQVANWSVSSFKGKLKFFRFEIVKYETRAFKRKIEIKPIPILFISLTANNHFWYCCPLFASDLMHNSTGYVIKQLVHAFSCALSSYGALGKFGEHSRS